jgi:sugar phosphate isomerase/epimerase
MKLMMFSKHLQSLSLAEAGKAVRELGFEGLDLTVRPGGFIEPQRVAQELTLKVRMLREIGLEVPLATTAITRADEPHARETFEAIHFAGISEIKLGYVRYGAFGTLQTTLDQAARDLEQIEALARATGLRANLHMHSGPYTTSNPAFVHWLIKDRDPAAIGAYVDPGHMTVEGGRDGWRSGLDLLGPRITLVAIKDMAWDSREDEKLGKTRWDMKMVPLRRGIVRWPDVFACLRHLDFTGWISVHSEYTGGQSWRDLTVPELLEQTREDLAYLREVMRRL